MRGADSIYRIQYDATSVQSILIYGITPLLTACFTIGSMIVMARRLDWMLALVAVTVTPVVIMMTLQGASPAPRRMASREELDSTALSVVQEAHRPAHRQGILPRGTRAWAVRRPCGRRACAPGSASPSSTASSEWASG